MSKLFRITVAAASKSYQNSRQQCVAYSRNSNIGAMVVNHCPQNSTVPSLVRRKCRRTSDISDPLLTNLVTDVSATVTYQNIYCAECNDVPHELMKFWNIGLYCESLRFLDVDDSFVRNNLKYRNDINKWGVRFGNKFHHCDLSLEKPEYLNVRECRTKPLKNCPPRWHRDAVKQACSSCKSINFNPLRNFHCLICKHEPDLSRTCNLGIISTRSEINTPMSFPILLDFSGCPITNVGSMTANCCANGEVYDPFTLTCREIVCGVPGYKLLNGKCKRI